MLGRGEAVNIGYTCNCAQCNGTLEPPEAPECPDLCRSMQVVYSECGGVGRCECFPDTLRGWLNAWWQGPCAVDPSPECDCPSPQEIAEDRAEARAEAMRDD